MRALCALLIALCLPTLASAEPLPSFERLTVVRGIEWGSYYDQIRLTLTRQPDGTYRADISGEDYPNAPQGLIVAESALEELKRAMWAMRGFSDDTFAGEGNHWYTEFDVVGTTPDGQAWQLKRWFFDSNSRQVSELVSNLEDAAENLIKSLLAPPASPASGGLAGAIGAGS